MSLADLTLALKAVAVNADAAKVAADAAAASIASASAAAAAAAPQFATIQDLTNAAIAGNSVFQNIAEGPLGGYLDSLTAILQDLKNPTTTSNFQQQNFERDLLPQFESLFRRFYGSAFSLDAYKKAIADALAAHDTTQAAQKRSTPSGGSARGGVKISLGGQTVIIDVLNDSGKSLSSFYKPDDPEYLKILQSTGKVGGG